MYQYNHTMRFFDRLSWRLAAVALAGMMASCSTFDMGDKVWYKQGGTIEERDRLLAAAEVQATQASSAYDPNNTGVSTNPKETERHTVLTFMTAAGWSLVPKSQAGSLDNAPMPDKPSQRSNSAGSALGR